MREKFFVDVYNYARKNPKTFILTADLGYKLFDNFEKNLKNQFFNVGASEQNMICLAAGLASMNAKVFVYSIGNFPSLRCLEFIRNCVCYNNLDVNIVSNGPGFSYGSLGFTHHSIEDIAAIRSLPNISIYNPSNSHELNENLKEILKFKTPKYIRLGKFNNLSENFKNQSSFIKPGILLITTGQILEEAIKLKTIMKNEQISIYSISKIKKISSKDKKNILNLIKINKKIYTLEENRSQGGFGSIILENFFQHLKNKEFCVIGIEDCFKKKIGDQKFMRKLYNLDHFSIAQLIKRSLK